LPPLPGALQISRSEEAALLSRADEFRFNGDIAAARLLYEKLAGMGSEKGAMSMAQSFDPLFLKSFLLAGVAQPDIAKAKHWYEVARKLGSREANERLRALATTN
jgi:TPR repeat protein